MPETGSISGKLSYPSESIPPLQVIAFNLNSEEYFNVTTSDNQSTYMIEGIPPGVYLVVAYLNNDDYAGGYTHAVICGLSVGCTDHSLIPFSVEQGPVTFGINPMDWYAHEGLFPPNPLK